jgi:hypothetical protein
MIHVRQNRACCVVCLSSPCLFIYERKFNGMKPLLLAIVLTFSVSSATAQQQTEPPQQTHAPEDARYEMIQSSVAARFTVKVDKYLGATWQIVKRANGTITWEIIEREKHPLDVVTPNRVNYQIYASGITLRDTFLLNINTGAAWRLTEETDEKFLFWQPILVTPN